MSPLVTIAMPVFNAGSYLRLSVISILSQTFTNWELIILDDGSTDDAINSIVDLRDERIHIIQDGNNRGLAIRLNECIDLARGQYFARMDQDDIAYPERIESQFKYLEGHKEIDLLATRAIAIDQVGMAVGVMPSKLTHSELCAKPWRGFYLAHPTWMGRLSWFKSFRYLAPGPYLCEDQELLLRSYHKSHFACLDQILFAYRVRDKISFKKNFKIRLTLLKIQIAHFADAGEYLHLLRAVLCFQIKLIADTLNKALGKGSTNFSGALHGQVLQQWSEVMTRLSEGK